VPGPVELIFFETCPHKIRVEWSTPSFNSYCITHYTIEWIHIISGKNNSSIQSLWVNNFVINDLESYEEYEVSVRAVNEKGESSNAVRRKTKTETKGKYQTHNIFVVSEGCDKM
jgi:hypothetical protein